MTIKAILYDHDGTLVDSEIAHFQIWANVLEPYGVSLSVQQYKEFYAGIPTESNAIDIVHRFALPVKSAVLVDAKNLATRTFLAQAAFPLMPGARESIAFFRDCGLQLAVVTGAERDGVDTSIRVHELHRHFSAIVSGDDVHQSKPAPDCYLLAMQLLGVVPNECIAIEDTEHGVAAATSAGIQCVAIPSFMSEHHNFNSAEESFQNLSDATKWITHRFVLHQ